MRNRYKYFISLLSVFLPLIPVFANQAKSNTEVQTGSAFPIWVAVAFLAGLIAGALVIYIFSRWKIYSILSVERHKYLHDLKDDKEHGIITGRLFRHLGIVMLLKKSKDKKVKLIDSQNRKISDLKTQNEKLKKEYRKRLEPDPEKGRQSKEDYYVETEEVIENKTELYFTIPESDGSFKDLNARKEKGLDCFYKIEPEDDCQSGKLHFLQGSYDLRALDNIDYYLSPVCEIQNISERSKARKIQMTGTGSVIKRGGRWIIDGKDKVKIKLIE